MTANTSPVVEDTELFFWALLEAGLSFIAINLPTVWSLLTKSTPERIMNHIRSLMSFDCGHSDPPPSADKPSQDSLSIHGDVDSFPEMFEKIVTGTYETEHIEA